MRFDGAQTLTLCALLTATIAIATPARPESAQAVSTPGVREQILGSPASSQHDDSSDYEDPQMPTFSEDDRARDDEDLGIATYKPAEFKRTESVGSWNEIDNSWMRNWLQQFHADCRQSLVHSSGWHYITQ